VCLITGAARGIGAAIAEEFLRHEAQVCLADVKSTAAEERRRVN